MKWASETDSSPAPPEAIPEAVTRYSCGYLPCSVSNTQVNQLGAIVSSGLDRLSSTYLAIYSMPHLQHAESNPRK